MRDTVSTLERVWAAGEMILRAAMTVLLVFCAFRLTLAGAWLEGLPVPLLALILGFYTRRRYREAQGLWHDNV